MIEIEGLRYAWPGARHDCLDIASLRIARGEHVFLHGESGGGKSTLLALMAGVLLPQQGRVSLLGRDWCTLSGAQRDAWRAAHVGYVFQQFNLLPYLSAADNVWLPCRFSALRRARALAGHASPREAVQALLAGVGLPRQAWSRPAAALSVGQQQRVAAARALLGVPEVVIADEPTSALDAALREAFMAMLLGQCRSAGSTLVFVSHDERLAARFDRVLALAQLNRAARAEAVPS